MEEKLTKLKTLLAEIDDLMHAAAVLGWDQQTYMPSGGAEDRGNQLGTLARLEHERWVSDEMGKLLDDLAPLAAQLDPDSDDACLLRVVRHQYEKRTRVPARWVEEFSTATTLGQEAWIKARKTADFSAFQPFLQHNIDLRREYATFFAPYEHVYDPQLDDFEPGMKTAEVQAIFNELRIEQVALVKEIASRPQVEFGFLFQPYADQAQWDFGVEVITKFGYDWNRGRQDRVVHPFCTGFGQGDVRITTRVDPNYPGAMLFGTMHECGHALYDQGHDPAHKRTPLSNGASMALHESQSRMWENLVGRSMPFWKHFYSRFQQGFSSQLGNVSLETFYKAINRVQPSLIRIEADEATYNLHIMLRMELEIALMEGSLAVKDLPEAWNARMQEYLGLTPPNDTKGVMQDVHWSGGMVGYFPTYALGNLVSVQLWEKIQQDIPDLASQFEQGEFGALLGWLRKNVHAYGAKYEPQVLVQKITGEKINPKPYLRYLKAKFGAIYGL
jgi:carboxypeptidase Taq